MIFSSTMFPQCYILLLSIIFLNYIFKTTYLIHHFIKNPIYLLISYIVLLYIYKIFLRLHIYFLSITTYSYHIKYILKQRNLHLLIYIQLNIFILLYFTYLHVSDYNSTSKDRGCHK